MTSSCRRMSQASAKLGRRAAPCPASSRTRSARARFLRKFSPVNRGLLRRQSSGERSSGLRKRPARNPRPRGLQATRAIPSSRRVGKRASSGSRVQSEYSFWTAATGGPRGRAHGGRTRPRRVPGAAPSPGAPGRPWRPRSPRWGPGGQPGAGSTGRCDPRRGASVRRRRPGGRSRGCRRCAPPPGRWFTNPNLVASTTPPRRPFSALPTWVSSFRRRRRYRSW